VILTAYLRSVCDGQLALATASAPRVRVMQKENGDSSMKMTVLACRVGAVSMHQVRRLSFVAGVLRGAVCLLSAFVVNPAACSTFHKVWMHGESSTALCHSAQTFEPASVASFTHRTSSPICFAGSSTHAYHFTVISDEETVSDAAAAAAAAPDFEAAG
jgi:hypothetical protein